MTEIVYSGHDNTCRITISQDGAALNFTSITRMTLALRGFTTLIDSDQHTGAIAWNSTGVVTFDLGDLNIPVGSYDATLVAYDSQHPNGQVLAHMDNRPARKDQILVFTVY